MFTELIKYVHDGINLYGIISISNIKISMKYSKNINTNDKIYLISAYYNDSEVILQDHITTVKKIGDGNIITNFNHLEELNAYNRINIIVNDSYDIIGYSFKGVGIKSVERRIRNYGYRINRVSLGGSFNEPKALIAPPERDLLIGTRYNTIVGITNQQIQKLIQGDRKT